MPCYPLKSKGDHRQVSFSMKLIPLQKNFLILGLPGNKRVQTIWSLLLFYICRWPKLGLSTAPVRMSQMLPAASSVCSSSRAGNQMMIPGKKKYATWGAAVKHLICIYITQTCFLYAEDRLLHEVDKSWLLIIA